MICTIRLSFQVVQERVLPLVNISLRYSSSGILSLFEVEKFDTFTTNSHSDQLLSMDSLPQVYFGSFHPPQQYTSILPKVQNVDFCLHFNRFYGVISSSMSEISSFESLSSIPPIAGSLRAPLPPLDLVFTSNLELQ